MEKWLKMFMDDNADGTPGGDIAPETPPDTDETPPGTPPEPTPAEQELAALKEENARLKAQTVPMRPLTSADMENYTDDQWAAIEAKSGGRDKATILQDFRNWELTNRQNAIDAKTSTTEAIQDALETNPKLTKLRGAIKEFMEEVPVTDRLDPAKLKRHMERAINYAKGKHIAMTPETTPKTNAPKHNDSPSPKANDEDGDDEAYKDGEIKDDEYVFPNNLRIRTGKTDKKVWKQIQHKIKDPNSVQIPVDFDKPPVFNK